AIATDFAGHCDILSGTNSLRLRSGRPIIVHDNYEPVAVWREPDVDEILWCLELIYEDRSRTGELEKQAAIDMQEFTWDRAARKFVESLVRAAALACLASARAAGQPPPATERRASMRGRASRGIARSRVTFFGATPDVLLTRIR